MHDVVIPHDLIEQAFRSVAGLHGYKPHLSNDDSDCYTLLKAGSNTKLTTALCSVILPGSDKTGDFMAYNASAIDHEDEAKNTGPLLHTPAVTYGQLAYGFYLVSVALEYPGSSHLIEPHWYDMHSNRIEEYYYA